MTPSVDELLLRWEEAREQGEPASVEELCRPYPEQTAELARRVRRLEALDGVFRTNEAEATTPIRANHANAAPKRLAGYEVVGVLGGGGMGVVYEGYDPVLRRRVALRVLALRVSFAADQDGDPAAPRVQREARVLGQLKHDHVVPIYDAELRACQQRFFVMELVEGGDLRDRIPQLAR